MLTPANGNCTVSKVKKYFFYLVKNCNDIAATGWYNSLGGANNSIFLSLVKWGSGEFGRFVRVRACLCVCVRSLPVYMCNCLFETMAAAVWPVRKAVKLSLPAVSLPLPICFHVTTAATCDCEGHTSRKKAEATSRLDSAVGKNEALWYPCNFTPS